MIPKHVQLYACRTCGNLCTATLDQLCDECRETAPPTISTVTWEQLGGGLQRQLCPGGWIYSQNGSICFVPDSNRGGRHA